MKARYHPLRWTVLLVAWIVAMLCFGSDIAGRWGIECWIAVTLGGWAAILAAAFWRAGYLNQWVIILREDVKENARGE